MATFLNSQDFKLQSPALMPVSSGGNALSGVGGLSGLLGLGAAAVGAPWLTPLITLGGQAISGIGAHQAAAEEEERRRKEIERQQMNLDRQFFADQGNISRSANMQGLDMLNQSFVRARDNASRRGLINDIRQVYG